MKLRVELDNCLLFLLEDPMPSMEEGDRIKFAVQVHGLLNEFSRLPMTQVAGVELATPSKPPEEESLLRLARRLPRKESPSGKSVVGSRKRRERRPNATVGEIRDSLDRMANGVGAGAIAEGLGVEAGLVSLWRRKVIGGLKWRQEKFADTWKMLTPEAQAEAVAGVFPRARGRDETPPPRKEPKADPKERPRARAKRGEAAPDLAAILDRLAESMDLGKTAAWAKMDLTRLSVTWGAVMDLMGLVGANRFSGFRKEWPSLEASAKSALFGALEGTQGTSAGPAGAS